MKLLTSFLKTCFLEKQFVNYLTLDSFYTTLKRFSTNYNLMFWQLYCLPKTVLPYHVYLSFLYKIKKPNNPG